MAIPDLQRYPWNLNPIKTVEDNVGFLTQKLLILIISPFFLISQKSEINFCREPIKENKQLSKTKTWISNSNLIRQSIVINRALSYFHERSLIITLTVPLRVTWSSFIKCSFCVFIYLYLGQTLWIVKYVCKHKQYFGRILNIILQMKTV